MSETITIRASMLSGYADCPRRAAAKQWRREIESAGFTLCEQHPSVGAAVGTAVHAAAAHMLRAKIKTGRIGSVDDGLEVAIQEFREEVAPGAVWDDTSPNRNTAELQIKRLTLSYRHGVVECIDPLAVEQAWRCNAGDGFALSGHCDVITRQGVIRDLKTGALPRPHQAQLGGYSLLARSQTPPVEVTGVAVDFIRRTPKTKPQDPPESKQYDLAVAETTAWATIRQIKSDMTRFRDSGDPWSFMANPLSMMCTPAYCPAHGSRFCDLGRDH